MDDFSSPGQTNSFGFAASPSNFIRPGKRPQSSISSTIAEDLATGEFVMATGAAGGSRIITTTLQYLYHHLDQGLGADDTVHQGRWHDKLTNETYFEIAQPELGSSFLPCTFQVFATKLHYSLMQGCLGLTTARSHILRASAITLHTKMGVVATAMSSLVIAAA